jgi:hypothetical protein
MHALHDTARGDAQAVPTQLCSTMAAARIRGTSPLPAPSGVVVPPSSTCMHRALHVMLQTCSQNLPGGRVTSSAATRSGQLAQHLGHVAGEPQGGVAKAAAAPA